METNQQQSEPLMTAAEERLSFDEYVGQLPASKQSTHRWMAYLIIAGILLGIGTLIFAIYTSVTWKTAGGSSVIMAWQYFFLAACVTVILMGIDTVVLGATLPLPIEGSKSSYKAGPEAVREGWTMVGIGVLVFLLLIVITLALRAGYLSLEDWITLIVGFWAVVGLLAVLLAVFRRIRKSQ